MHRRPMLSPAVGYHRKAPWPTRSASSVIPSASTAAPRSTACQFLNPAGPKRWPHCTSRSRPSILVDADAVAIPNGGSIRIKHLRRLVSNSGGLAYCQEGAAVEDSQRPESVDADSAADWQETRHRSDVLPEPTPRCADHSQLRLASGSNGHIAAQSCRLMPNTRPLHCK